MARTGDRTIELFKTALFKNISIFGNRFSIGRWWVAGCTGKDHLDKALEGSVVVIIPARVPRKKGIIRMSRDDIFNINTGIVKISCHCHRQALVNMISNPLNLMVSVATEVYKKAGTYDEKKLFGITTLDVLRVKTFYAAKAKDSPEEINVPVVGDHAGIPILPLFS